MARQQPARQRVRKGLIIGMFLVFPLILYFFSPVLIVESATRGIINGSFITFGLLLLSALFFGRAWCGWLCPGAGLQEACFAVRNQAVSNRRLDLIKWLIWLPWVAAIAVLAWLAGGYRQVEPLYPNNAWVAIADTTGIIVYYAVLALILIPSLTAGRRGFCHTLCWMAPFMVIGRTISNRLGLPALRLRTRPDSCTGCTICTRNCPMSLDVTSMVKSGAIEHAECILCGTCVDTCPKGAISFSFRGSQTALIGRPEWPAASDSERAPAGRSHRP